jgi:hypothetical protein
MAHTAMNARTVDGSHEEGHTVYLDQRPVPGFDTLVAQSIPVAGVSFRQREVVELVKDPSAHLELRRDPDNPHSPDGSAIAVTGTWHDKKGALHQGQVGYVPSMIAQEIKRTHPDAKLLATINCMFLPQPGKSAGLRMSIWAGADTPRPRCAACGKPLPVDAAFCPGCGSEAQPAGGHNE